MNAARLTGLAALALGLVSCDKGIFEEPAARATSVSISYDLSPAALVVAGGPAAAFDATNALSVVLSRGEAVVFDTLMSFVPAEETRVSLEVPPQSEDEDLGLEFTLLNGEQAIFRGAGS
ncbi:MAG TPA: hypothetical protein VFR81_27340, partial [Longimicrobium sp.]|nr:hypothetical protein [Longimicrobium sp.]